MFVRYAPFNRLQKFLFSFGYFPLYEYAIIARNYALGLLLITLLCCLFKERYRRPLWIGCVLLLLAHTSIYGLIVTIAIGVALFCEFLWFRTRGAASQTPPTRKNGKKAERDVWPTVDMGRRVWLSFALIGLGIFTAVVQLNPPSDSGVHVGWNFHFNMDFLSEVMKLISRTFLPIPDASLHFWYQNQLEVYPLFQDIELSLSFFLLLCGVLLVRKRPTVLLIYLMSMLGLLTFFYVKYYGQLRNHGFLFVTFLMVAWIYRDCPESHVLERKSAARKPESTGFTAWQRAFNTMLTFILVCQCISGIIAVRMELQHVFSFGEQTAEYIKDQGLQDLPMVGDADFAVVTVVGYLQKDHVYYVQGNRLGSFVTWDQARSCKTSSLS